MGGSAREWFVRHAGVTNAREKAHRKAVQSIRLIALIGSGDCRARVAPDGGSPLAIDVAIIAGAIAEGAGGDRFGRRR